MTDRPLVLRIRRAILALIAPMIAGPVFSAIVGATIYPFIYIVPRLLGIGYRRYPDLLDLILNGAGLGFIIGAIISFYGASLAAALTLHFGELTYRMAAISAVVGGFFGAAAVWVFYSEYAIFAVLPFSIGSYIVGSALWFCLRRYFVSEVEQVAAT
ncbi:MAG: hypothetical protein AAFP80_05460 [Pseudomonadota bacterium]